MIHNTLKCIYVVCALLLGPNPRPTFLYFHHLQEMVTGAEISAVIGLSMFLAWFWGRQEPSRDVFAASGLSLFLTWALATS